MEYFGYPPEVKAHKTVPQIHVLLDREDAKANKANQARLYRELCEKVGWQPK